MAYTASITNVIGQAADAGLTAFEDLLHGITGPTSKLYDTPYSKAMYQYPDDLGTKQKGHMVLFTAYKTDPAGYQRMDTYHFNPNSVGNVVTGVGKAVLNAASAATEVGMSVLQAVGQAAVNSWNDAGNIAQKTDLAFQPKRSKSSDVIALYMPDTVNFQYDVSYENVSLKEAGSDVASAAGGLASILGKATEFDALGSAVSSTTGAIGSTIDSAATKLGLSAGGFAVNPQQQLLFQGIDFRTFQLAFTLTPKSLHEADQIKRIIQCFRSHAAPTLQQGAAGMLFVVPDSWVIQFINLDDENRFLNKVKECVLTNVDVNYAPNGTWTTYDNGAPVQTNLTLQFKEIALVDKTAIDNGF